jgi:uncharacterized membrane protein
MSTFSDEQKRAVLGVMLAQTALTLAHSLKTRGLRRTLLFAALGIGIPSGAEYLAINCARALRHHTEPQLANVPLPIMVGWYNAAYPTFAAVEALLAPLELKGTRHLIVLPLLTAIAATSLDTLLDPMGLDQGLWEWTEGGPYAADIVGPNGVAGIPVGNFVGWLVLTSLVPALYLALTRNERPAQAAGRTAALLLVPNALAALGWAAQRGKLRFVLPALPALLLLALALFWRPPENAKKEAA